MVNMVNPPQAPRCENQPNHENHSADYYKKETPQFSLCEVICLPP